MLGTDVLLGTRLGSSDPVTETLDGGVGDKEDMGAVEIDGAFESKDPTILGVDVTMGDIKSAERDGTAVLATFMDPSIVEDRELATVGDKDAAEKVGKVGPLVETVNPLDGAGVSLPPIVGVPVPPTTPGDWTKAVNVTPIVGGFVSSRVTSGVPSGVGELVSVGIGDTVAEETGKLVGDAVKTIARVGDGVGASVRKVVGEGVTTLIVGTTEGALEVLKMVGPCVEGAGDCVGGSNSKTGINFGKYNNEGSRSACLFSYSWSKTE